MYQLSRIDPTNADSASDRTEHATQPASSQIGTFLWIGDRVSPESVEVYQYCEATAPQMAHRVDLKDAMERPATGVTHLLIHRTDRSPAFESHLAYLTATYPKAIVLELLGTIWEGNVLRRESKAKTQPFYWHRWNQVMPPLLRRDGSQRPTATMLPNQSVAIIAPNFSDAEPLMDVATSVGAASVWCRNPQCMTARNCSVVWWDDSAARSASARQWRIGIDAAEKYSSIRPQHVWLASAPRIEQYLRARRAGIDVVFSKPYRIDALISTLVGCHADLSARPTSRNMGPNPIKRVRTAA